MRSRGERMSARPWSRLRRQVLARADHTCERCGLRYRPMEVHHRNGRRDDNRLENLAAWCVRCHIDFHKGKVTPGADEWRSYVDGLI